MSRQIASQRHSRQFLPRLTVTKSLPYIECQIGQDDQTDKHCLITRLNHESNWIDRKVVCPTDISIAHTFNIDYKSDKYRLKNPSSVQNLPEGQLNVGSWCISWQSNQYGKYLSLSSSLTTQLPPNSSFCLAFITSSLFFVHFAAICNSIQMQSVSERQYCKYII